MSQLKKLIIKRTLYWKLILKRAKDYHESDKERLMQKPEINTETYLRKKKIKRENMEERDTIICLKKRNKNYKNIKKKKNCEAKNSQSHQ